jgi:hypothetical protein
MMEIMGIGSSFKSQSVKTDAGYTGTVIFSKNENF